MTSLWHVIGVLQVMLENARSDAEVTLKPLKWSISPMKLQAIRINEEADGETESLRNKCLSKQYLAFKLSNREW